MLATLPRPFSADGRFTRFRPISAVFPLLPLPLSRLLVRVRSAKIGVPASVRLCLLTARRGELFARFGGRQSVHFAAGLRQPPVRLSARTPVPHNDALLEVPTLSIGVAAFPDHGATPEEVLKAADLALYRPKTLGRNRVVVAPVDLRLDAAPAPTTKV